MTTDQLAADLAARKRASNDADVRLTRWVVTFASGAGLDLAARCEADAADRAVRFRADDAVVMVETVAEYVERERRELVADLRDIGAYVVGMENA